MKMLFFLLLTIVFTISVSRKENISNNSMSSRGIELQKEIVVSNTWKVSLFTEKGVDLTSDFSTYLFQFNNDGSAVVTSSGIGILYYGSWNLLHGNHTGYDDSTFLTNDDRNILFFTLAGHHHMDQISEGWKIVILTGSEIWLLNDNKNSSKEIHFTKNS